MSLSGCLCIQCLWADPRPISGIKEPRGGRWHWQLINKRPHNPYRQITTCLAELPGLLHFIVIIWHFDLMGQLNLSAIVEELHIFYINMTNLLDFHFVDPPVSFLAPGHPSPCWPPAAAYQTSPHLQGCEHRWCCEILVIFILIGLRTSNSFENGDFWQTCPQFTPTKRIFLYIQILSHW